MKKQLKNEQQEIFFEMEYWEEKKILYCNWIGSYLSVEQVQEGALSSLDVITQYKCTNILNDNRQLEGVWDEANEWIANEWTPQAIAVGLRKFAHILSNDLFAQLSAEFLEDNNQSVKDIFHIRLFNNQEEAEKWLME